MRRIWMGFLILWCGLTTLDAATVNLAWDAPTTNANNTTLTDLAGYQLFWRLPTGSYGTPISVGLVTTATIPNLQGNTSYVFAAKAIDTSGNLSGFSNEITAMTAADPVPPPPPPPGTGPVAAWGMNEGAGTTTADATGHGWMGALHSATWSPGHSGQGLSFNGSTAYVSVASGLDLTVPFTLNAWVKPSSYADYRTIVSQRDTWSSSGMRLNWTLDSGSGQVMLQQPNSQLTFGYAPPLNTWTHLALVAEASSTRLYVNGGLRQTLGSFTPGSKGTAQVRLGMNADGPDAWAGTLDDVRIYTRALSAVEVQADMNTPVSPTTTPTGATGLAITFQP